MVQTGTPNGPSLVWALLLDKESGEHICKVGYVKGNLSWWRLRSPKEKWT